MSLMCTTRFGSARFLLVCKISLLFGCGSHLLLWRARVGSGWSILDDESLSDNDSGNDPRALIAKSDYFYCFGNGVRATPLYTKAEPLFAERAYIRNSIPTKVEHLRPEAEIVARQIESIVQQCLAEVRNREGALETSRRLFEPPLAPIPDTTAPTNLIIASHGGLNLLQFQSLSHGQDQLLLKEPRTISYIRKALHHDHSRKVVRR